MALLKDLVVFRDDLYFEGAVQADWFYQDGQVDAVSKSFVFHGPKNHAVSQSDFGGHGLMDTASFALHLAQKADDPEYGSPLTLAIAGYGTGKSHLAVTLSALFSGASWKPELHERIIENIARADEEIAQQIRPFVRKPRLVLTINGMRDFNLHYELLRTAEKALRVNNANLDVLKKLNKVKETASVFIERTYDLVKDSFDKAASDHGLYLSGEALKEHLLHSLDNELGTEFNIINTVYTEFNGHPIRLDEGVSASLVLDTLLQECCGLHGQFDGIVILFDEFGRFLEYVSSNPAAAGDSALQQIFESVQNAEGDIQFIGFIQSDIKSYLQRVDKSSNISRYIDRYDAGEKIYLSSNLETIFANLLEKKDKNAFNQLVVEQMDNAEAEQKSLFTNLQKWLPLQGIWNTWQDYRRVIIEEIYPLHPISTYLLCNLTDWLQSRSSLTLLSEKVRLMGNCEVGSGQLPLIFPVDLLKGAFFDELLNAEQQGRQRSQFCILLDSIYRKFDTKLTAEAKSVLLANLIIRICRFHFDQRSELISAIIECSGLSLEKVNEAIQILEDEYAVLSYDDRLVCFDFVADAVGANQFRNYLRAAQNRRTFQPDMLAQNDIQDLADVLKSIDTDFGSKHGIQTREWSFIQRIEHIQNTSSETISSAYRELKTHTLPNTERGVLIWVYMPKEAQVDKLDQLVAVIAEAEDTQAVTVMALDDTDNSLQDAILSYRVLADMKEEDKNHYHRFYADALDKAREKVSLLFADLKQQRKIITANGIESANSRLKVYLGSVFEKIYPKVMPFDFEGFDAKGANGSAYKNFCTIMKWILMDDMSYVVLKSQTSDVKNRVESLLGPVGIYSWRALNNEYRGVMPANAAVGKLYNSLENLLNTKKVIPFKKLSALLTSAPYGMNEYAAFLFLGLFSQQFSYTTKLEIDDTRFSTRTWAEEVLQEKKFDIKLFQKTKLLLVDTGDIIKRFKNIYTRIKKNTDFSAVIKLREDLETLKKEESVPDALQAEDDLAMMLLNEGDKARRVYTERVIKIDNDLASAKRNLNPYDALSAALETMKLSLESFAGGRYVYSAEQTEEMNAYIEEAKRVAAQAFADGWVKRYTCSKPEKLGSYKHFASKACELFNRFGFVKESMELASVVDKEEKRIQLIIDQENLINACESYLLTSQIRTGMTQKNLTAFLEQGKDLVKEFDKFDYEIDKQFVDLRERTIERVKALEAAIKEFAQKLTAIWDAVNEISSIDDVRNVHARIEAILSSGLTDRDREDLENIDRELSAFLADASELMKRNYGRDDIRDAFDEVKQRYSEYEIDFSIVIENICLDLLKVMDEKEEGWENRYLSITPEQMSQGELDQWKHETQPIPGFVKKENIERYNLLASAVEKELNRQKIDYIVMLYNQLNDDERMILLTRLNESCGK